MRSKLESFKPESIRTILKKINDDLNDEFLDIQNYSDTDYSDYSYAIESTLKDLGMPSDNEDINFILACFEKNPNFENVDESLNIPQIKSFIVNHSVVRDVRMLENMSQEIDSYLDVTENLVEQYQELDLFHLYDGEITDTDYLDSDWVNEELESIHEK
jgi:ADP-dependent phosphofructokinase/glucokinase